MFYHLDTLAVECNEISRSKGWLQENRTFGDLISLMHSELSEALEEFRAGRGFDEMYWACKHCNYEPQSEDEMFSRECSHKDYVECSFQPEGIPIELADVIIRVLQATANLGIPIGQAVEVKMEFNRTRPHRHGGKRI